MVQPGWAVVQVKSLPQLAPLSRSGVGPSTFTAQQVEDAAKNGMEGLLGIVQRGPRGD